MTFGIPFKPGTDAVYTWCPSPRYPLPIMEHLSLLIDDGAATPVLPFDGRNLAPINYLIYDLTSLAHRLKGNGETLVIGCGGGRDVLTGLITGAERIDAVDVNPLIFDAMNNALGQFNGYLYKHPKVRAIVSEGRAFARRNPGKYDLLQVAMIDTWAATTAGAYALSENNLYTVEAFEDYLRALKPGGIFSFTRFFFTPPRQALRLVSLYLEAASRLGIERPDQGILIARYESLATLIFKGEPFTSDEINRFRHDIADLGFELVYAPDARPDPHFRTLIESRNREAFYASYPFDVSPSIDERPFFFNMLKMKDFLRVFEIREGQKFNYYATYTLLWLLILSIASTLLVIFLPLLVWGERISGLPGRGWLLTYFAGIGLAYIMIETVLIQRFMLLLENPVYSAGAVVALMLIASGSGSLFFSPRQTSDFKIIGSRKFEWHVLAFAVIALFAMLHIFQGASINSWALSMPMGVRVALIVLLLLPLGFAMGIPLPAGMQFAAPGGPSTIAWCWAVNGAASVVASPFAVALSMGQGFRVSLTWAFIFYGIAFGALMMLRLTYHQPIERTVD
ncbi:MAG: hypothetical protein FJY67_05880 [Calditrichaeota bacterium]|nr:hypothetical protein [Calditrichota bacterium]